MRGYWKQVEFLVVLGSVLVLPASVAAETMSVTQTITITARVAPMRSIVVNEQGRITKIFSNTGENVAPKAYLNKAPGEPRPVTQALLIQYNQILAQQKNLIGVEIPVEPPRANDNSVRNFLVGTVSTLSRQLKF